MAGRSEHGMPTPYAEDVLDLVAMIPAGHVLSYGGVAQAVGRGGARSVGTVLARWGSGVPWHRVVRADGTPAPVHRSVALRRLIAEGTPLTPSGNRVDMLAAAWCDPPMSDLDAVMGR